MIEEGYAILARMTMASDSHSTVYGGVRCLGTPVVRTDAADIWATDLRGGRSPKLLSSNPWGLCHGV